MNLFYTSKNFERALLLTNATSQVVEGAWELCGEFENVLSCVIMGDNNYLDIFADESVRVTMLRKLDLPDELPEIPALPEVKPHGKF